MTEAVRRPAAAWAAGSDRHLPQEERRITMKSLCWVLLMGVMALAGCATQGDMYGLDARLAAVEQQNASLQKRLEKFDRAQTATDQKLRDQTAVLYATLDKVQEDIRLLSGRLDETEYLLKKQLNAVRKSGTGGEPAGGAIEERLSDLQRRVRRIEQYLSLEAGTPGAAAAAPQKRTLSQNELYLKAKQAFDAGDYAGARAAFQDFLKRFPRAKNADNAQFWIGETYYREKWYEKAILEYQKVIEKYPKGNKVPASLLKQGLAFYNIGDKANARLILNELIAKYPHSREAKIAKKKLNSF